MKHKIRRFFLFLLLSGVWFYRTLLSPMMVSRCRFVPTCSEYAVDALQIHGPWRGVWLTLKRVMKCHPWGGHGLDEVPEGRLKSRETK